jgi:hypothetical protein
MMIKYNSISLIMLVLRCFSFHVAINQITFSNLSSDLKLNSLLSVFYSPGPLILFSFAVIEPYSLRSSLRLAEFLICATFGNISNYLDIRGLAKPMNSIDGLLLDRRIPRWFKDKHIRRRSQVESTVSDAPEGATPLHQL